MYKVKWIGMLLMSLILMFGCLPKNVQTQSGQAMDKKAQYVYAFLDYSKLFSDTTGKLTRDMLEREIINEEEKEEIGTVWKKHRKYHSLLQEEYKVMYDKIDNGEEVTNYETIRSLTTKVMKETELMSKLMNRYFDGIQVPESLVSRMFELYELITEREE